MRIVVVGAGLAGMRTAQALRRNGFEGELTVVGDEEPYDRPPLSKGYLAGMATRETLSLVKGDEDVDLREDRAVRLDLAGKLLVAANSEIPYDKLVIATGARARPSPWQPASGVHVLRSLADCHALQEDLRHRGDVVVVGAGFIGGEVASTCRALGHDVTLVDPQEVPMARLMGDELGRHAQALHETNGVTTRFGVGVEAITGERGALKVSLTDGSVVPCAVVVVGIGAEPNDEWLRDSGLLIDDGVVCDEQGLTSDPDVYAVGDVARWGDTRAEHWTNAVEQAGAVARAITDQPAAQRAPGFVWSDQHDAKFTIVGEQTAEVVVIRRETELIALFRAPDGRLAGGATVNSPKASIKIRKVMRSGSAFDDVVGDF